MIGSPLAARFVPAANVEPRRGRGTPDMLILHYTGMESCAAAERQLCSAESGVSCHYLVDEDGTITQMVDEALRAWHAGLSSWEGDGDCNSRSIGIEIHNQGHTLTYTDFPPAQMRAVAALCRDIVARHAIAPRLVLAHSDVAPARKIDPGERFDWGWLHRQGVGHWVAPALDMDGPSLREGDRGADVAALQDMLAGYGYGVPQTGVYDAATATVVKAFQRHFRPARIDGIADAGTVDTLKRLAAGV